MGGFATGLASGLAGTSGSKDDKKDEPQKVNEFEAKPVSYKRGGKVKRSGKAKVHRGERVLTRKQTKEYERKRGRK